MAKKSVHLICNAHIDPAWLWEWEEGAGETLSTFRIAAELCEKNNIKLFLVFPALKISNAIFCLLQIIVKYINRAKSLTWQYGLHVSAS